MSVWEKSLNFLQGDLTGAEFNTWILPLQALENGDELTLLAPNRFVKEWVEKHYSEEIAGLCEHVSEGRIVRVVFDVGTARREPAAAPSASPRSNAGRTQRAQESPERQLESLRKRQQSGNLNAEFTFETFVEGKSNQIARAASFQIGNNPGKAYNPLFIYGGVGLGKTHLMHAVGNMVLQTGPGARVAYLHSERFVAEMVRALQHNTIDDFKRKYRSVNALLIDDVQFFANKERSQEEFFHTFNALFESKQQIVLSSDRFPKEVIGLEERLRSRFGWGLTVAIEPPDLETRVAILQSKAIKLGANLPEDVGFFVGRRIRSNVRDLEGALRRLIANSEFTGQPITLDFAKEALRDMLSAQDKQVTMENIQKTVAGYYKIRVADMLSSKRNRSIARPRQVAMALAKELTKHSLPEIGAAFGGKDHTTVLHATRRIKGLRETEQSIEEDYNNLRRILTS